MVGKRAREDEVDNQKPPLKRVRALTTDHLSRLSDELTLRVLSFLSTSQLVKCQRYVLFLHPINNDYIQCC